MRETWKDSGVGPDKSQKWIRGDRWSKEEGRKSSFCLIDGHLSFEECRIGGEAQKIQRSSCTPRRFCERWFWILCSIHRTRIISITNDSSKNHGYHLQTARGAMDKQLMQYLLIPRFKWKMLQNYWKCQNRNVQSFGFVYHDTDGQNHGPVWKTQSFLLSEICTVILWQDCYGKDNLKKSYWSTVGERFPIGNAYSYTVKKGCSYLCMWMDIQLSIYGALSGLCEEHKACHVRTERLVLAGQSDPLFVPTSSLMKTPTPLTDDPAQEDLLQKYQERLERLSQQNRVIEICTNAGFLTTVDVGQYFMTKDTEEFSQFTESVACREYTLPSDEKLSDPKGWIRGNTKIGPVLKVTTSYLQGKYGVEIRIEHVNKDNSHSWVRILMAWISWSRTWSTKSTTTTSRKPLKWSSKIFASKTNVLAFASRSKAKGDVLLPAHLQELYPLV